MLYFICCCSRMWRECQHRGKWADYSIFSTLRLWLPVFRFALAAYHIVFFFLYKCAVSGKYLCGCVNRFWRWLGRRIRGGRRALCYSYYTSCSDYSCRSCLCFTLELFTWKVSLPYQLINPYYRLELNSFAKHFLSWFIRGVFFLIWLKESCLQSYCCCCCDFRVVLE